MDHIPSRDLLRDCLDIPVYEFPPSHGGSTRFMASFLRFLDHDAPHSVGLLGTSDQFVAQTSTWQHTILTTDKHTSPSGIQTHNHSTRAAADLRLRTHGHWDRHQCNS